ncbi:MAG TPA: hypothetical protein VHE53_01780 [Patescibacteria group bacterium]|nr:hypothetical protein [Patescibacteria group bacterium]
MATEVIHEHVDNANSSNNSLIGVILIALIFLFFLYFIGTRVLSGVNNSTPSVQIPDKVDVNVKSNK